MLQLTTDQIQFFNDHGYLRLESLADPEEIWQIRATIEMLFEQRAGENEGAYGELIARADEDDEANSPQIHNPFNYAPHLHNGRCFQNAQHIAKQLLGNEARFFLDLTILKVPETGAGTPWHQDAAYRDPRFEYKEVAIWVPLQDVEVKSGCMQFLPDSHKNPVLQHRSANNDSRSLALQTAGCLDTAAAVACPLPAGGCTIHHPRTLHCSGPNLSSVPRLAYIMTFGITPMLAKENCEFPWLDQRETAAHVAKRRWMRRGGIFVTAWRRIRRGDLTGWRSTIYWLKRFARTFRRGA